MGRGGWIIPRIVAFLLEVPASVASVAKEDNARSPLYPSHFSSYRLSPTGAGSLLSSRASGNGGRNVAGCSVGT
ncbi:hypothetical protein N658DRAFT_492864 [Parathielavia hyrcaniae]|uniref:Secreted protein n=1 Tax=Parathielavia hyrcaniae TaxID=113614 RepID=A0AAN6QAK8_9PEZI|nr:hypothetical protein N658DRAFT_492864 [Parathielavia hyrcaniae]